MAEWLRCLQARMSRFASATSTLARMASTRAAAAPKQTRSLMGRPGNMWSTFAKDFGEEHSWPFVGACALAPMPKSPSPCH